MSSRGNVFVMNIKKKKFKRIKTQQEIADSTVSGMAVDSVNVNEYSSQRFLGLSVIQLVLI